MLRHILKYNGNDHNFSRLAIFIKIDLDFNGMVLAVVR